jgi:hypothetical protein
LVTYPRAIVRLTFLLASPSPASLLPYPANVPTGWLSFLAPGISLVGGVLDLLQSLASPIPYSVQVVPKRLVVRRTPYREADTATVEVDYRNFPFDPRVARAVAMVAYIGQGRDANDPLDISGLAPIFTGYADDGRWEAGDTNQIELNGRDQTALLLDAKWSGEMLDLAKPLEELVRSIVGRQAATKGFEVEVRGKPPVLASVRADTGSTQAAAPTDSLWDVISNLAAQAGMVAWVEINRVIIAPAQSVRNAAATPAFVLGQNLKRLVVKRLWQRRSDVTVVVRSYDVATGTTLSAVYPESAEGDFAGTGEKREQEAMLFTVSNVTSKAELARIARQIYERRAIADVEIELETKEMVGLAGEDLTALKAGDSIAVIVGAEEREFLHRRTTFQRTSFLISRGYDPEVALAIAAAYDTIAKVYQVEVAEHRFGTDGNEGYSLRVTALNYLEAGA